MYNSAALFTPAYAQQYPRSYPGLPISSTVGSPAQGPELNWGQARFAEPKMVALMAAFGGLVGLTGGYIPILKTRLYGPRFAGSVEREIAKNHAPLFIVNSSIAGAATGAITSYAMGNLTYSSNWEVYLKIVSISLLSTAITGLPMWIKIYEIWKKQGKKSGMEGRRVQTPRQGRRVQTPRQKRFR